MVHRALQDVGLGHEVGVEDEHQFALGSAQSILQSARLESGPVGAAHVLDIQIGQVALQGRDLAQAEVLCLVGGIVEHLHLETITGVANGRDGIKQALDHVHLIEQGKLHRDRGQLRVVAGDLRLPIAVLVVEEHQQRTVEAVDCQGEQADKIERGDDTLDIHGA